MVWQIEDAVYYLGLLGSVIAPLVALLSGATRFDPWRGLLRTLGLAAVLFLGCFPADLVVCAFLKGTVEHWTGGEIEATVACRSEAGRPVISAVGARITPRRDSDSDPPFRGEMMSQLFAQQTVQIIDHTVGTLTLTTAAGLASFLVVVLLFLGLRNRQIRREWEHAERMRALEMGLPVPASDAPWAKAAVCIAIGAGVPLVAFVATGLAFSSRPFMAGEVWIAPAVVSGFSVVGASILAGVLFQGRSRSDEVPAGARTRHPGPGMKTSHDPDALDVVGRRG